MNIYHTQLKNHYSNPNNYGTLKGANIISGQMIPSCGDVIDIQALVENNVIKNIAFTGKGCIISQAAASMLLEKLIGMQIEDILQLDSHFVLDLIKLGLGPNRTKCAMLALVAVQEGVVKYKSLG